MEVKQRQLKEDDVLPRGVGVDEASALIVKVVPESARATGGNGGGGGGVVAGMVRRLKSLRFGGCVSASAVKSPQDAVPKAQ